MKTCIYSVLVNDYDHPQPATVKGIDHIMFTDDPDLKAKSWKIIPIEKTDDQRLQRKIKILGHPELEKYDVTIYIDASISLNNRFPQLLRSYKGGLMIGSHGKRNCVYAEGLEVKKQKKADPEAVNDQIAEYYENDFPINFGMWSSGFMIRDKSTKDMCDIWHAKLEQHTHRDQLSLPWALHETGIKPVAINMHSYMSIKPHKSKEIPKVFYSTPFDRDKDIGKANNEFIELMPDESWICITDSDAMFLNPDYGKRVEDIIMNHGDKWDLIGCLTNRIGSNHQCYNGQFSNEMDMREHWKIAHSELEDKVVDGGVAGFFMLFSKKTWRKAGGFKTKSISCDSQFNKDVRKVGGKVGVYQGLYMFHAYRINENDQRKAQQSISHLR